MLNFEDIYCSIEGEKVAKIMVTKIRYIGRALLTIYSGGEDVYPFWINETFSYSRFNFFK